VTDAEYLERLFLNTSIDLPTGGMLRRLLELKRKQKEEAMQITSSNHFSNPNMLPLNMTKPKSLLFLLLLYSLFYPYFSLMKL
jgi:hypothetical protein